ncbi:Palmitoyltransferase ZDHHC9 [Geodia barretti]|uniref:Palmitoyltransferase n=1 Tax=Geodia barretti TaxID=519541 RepID=A0AA35TCN6_GEOBA|nr:Palmitoyltransferase ZDHHC9 [Geodia barretti]
MVKARYQLIMPLRKYQKFPGNNRFWCCGALMSSRQVSILIFCAIIIVVVSALFFAFDARFLVVNVEPLGVGVIFPVLGVLGLYFSMSFLFKTGCIDSGILPRALPDEIAYMQSQGDEEPAGSGRTLGAPARYKTVQHMGQKVKLKWCVTCNLWRPPRASHCGLCNNCYENFDHHCPWVGNCVARRNYRYFYLFLTTIAVTGVYMMACNITVIVLASKKMGFGDALKTYPGSVIEFCVSGLAVISVSGLSCMHTWLIARMETTNEDIKGTFNPRKQGRTVHNPYRRRNCCLNFLFVICGPFPPRFLSLIVQILYDGEAAHFMSQEQSVYV